MKLIDQYIIAIGQKLPLKGREDIKKELRGLLLDEIEGKYGSDANEKQVMSVISTFGPPAEVAAKYAGKRILISPELTDIYLLVTKVLLFAMTVSFSILFLLQLFTNGFENGDVVKNLLLVPFQIFSASLNGIGAFTIVFIIMTALSKKININQEKEWKPEKLKEIRIEQEKESKLECVITIFFTTLFIILFNLYPGIITNAENAFSENAFALGHQINITQFKGYVIVLTILFIMEIIYHIILLKTGIKTTFLMVSQFIISLFSLVLFAVMVLDKGLYTYDNGWPGFKMVFLLVVIVNTAELLAKAGKAVYYKVLQS